MRLSTKLLVTFVPLFIVAIVGSYLLTVQASEEQMLEQAKVAAFQKAHIVREALVSQMVDKYKVEDGFLNKIRTAGGLKDLYIRIRPDNLHLMEDLEDSARTVRLMARMQDAMAKGSIGDEVFTTKKAMYVRREDDFEAIIPFKAEKKCLACHEVEIDHVLGVAHVNLPLAEINMAIQENSNRTAMISLGFAAVSLAIGFVFYRTLIQKPVGKLVTATEELRKGNLNYEVGKAKTNDELGLLADSFDRMRKALKQSQEALRTSTVGQIAQSLIRDFRAPMREILTSVDQVKRGASSDEQRQQLCESATGSVQTMQKITQDLLEFTTGDLKANKMACRIPQLMGYVEQMVRPDLEREGIKLEVVQGFQGSARVDYDRFARAIINIISYAANYVPPDGVVRLITASENNSLVVKVEDNGSGIASAFLDKIFEPFVKIVQEKGVGLSLALAKRIVDMQGGKVVVESTEGKGTTFTITMPMS
ncbi:MAG: ATP-binding protein [Bacteroidota bacterium]